jgi:hypothetical protein
LAIWRTGAGACGEVSSAIGGSLGDGKDGESPPRT